MSGRLLKEHCLTTLTDGHINVTEHVYLAHQRLQADLGNFVICRIMVREGRHACQQVGVERTASTNADLARAQARKRAWRPFLVPPRNIHRLFHEHQAFLSEAVARSRARLSELFRPDGESVGVLRLEFFGRALDRQHHHSGLLVSLFLHPPMRRRERLRRLVRPRRRHRQLNVVPVERILLVVRHTSTVETLPLTRKALIVPRSGRLLDWHRLNFNHVPQPIEFPAHALLFVTVLRREDLERCLSPHALRLVTKHQRSRCVWRRWLLHMIDVLLHEVFMEVLTFHEQVLRCKRGPRLVWMCSFAISVVHELCLAGTQPMSPRHRKKHRRYKTNQRISYQLTQLQREGRPQFAQRDFGKPFCVSMTRRTLVTRINNLRSKCWPPGETRGRLPRVSTRNAGPYPTPSSRAGRQDLRSVHRAKLHGPSRVLLVRAVARQCTHQEGRSGTEPPLVRLATNRVIKTVLIRQTNNSRQEVNAEGIQMREQLRNSRFRRRSRGVHLNCGHKE